MANNSNRNNNEELQMRELFVAKATSNGARVIADFNKSMPTDINPLEDGDTFVVAIDSQVIEQDIKGSIKKDSSGNPVIKDGKPVFNTWQYTPVTVTSKDGVVSVKGIGMTAFTKRVQAADPNTEQPLPKTFVSAKGEVSELAKKFSEQSDVRQALAVCTAPKNTKLVVSDAVKTAVGDKGLGKKILVTFENQPSWNRFAADGEQYQTARIPTWSFVEE